MRMTHDEEHVNGVQVQEGRDRAPRHWHDPLVGPNHRCTSSSISTHGNRSVIFLNIFIASKS